MKEIWKEIPGYKGVYHVSNTGKVMNVRTGHIKKKNTTQGPSTVSVAKETVKNAEFVHRLVANAFIPNPYRLPEVRFIDGDKQNANVKNLEWTGGHSGTGPTQIRYDVPIVFGDKTYSCYKAVLRNEKIPSARLRAMLAAKTKGTHGWEGKNIHYADRPALPLLSQPKRKIRHIRTGDVFNTVREARSRYCVGEWVIRQHCNKKLKSGNYRWEYYIEEEN